VALIEIAVERLTQPEMPFALRRCTSTSTPRA
jgi:hypothetical protein